MKNKCFPEVWRQIPDGFSYVLPELFNLVAVGVLQHLSYTHKGKKKTFPSHSMYYGREYRHYMPSFKWVNMFNDKDKRCYDAFETVFYHLDDDKAAPADLTDTVCYTPFRPITVEEDKYHINWVKSGDEKAYYLDGMNEVYDMDDPNDKLHYGGPLRHRSRYYNVKKFYDRTRTLISRCLEMPVSKEEEKDGKNTFRGMTEKYGDCLYIKPFPLKQAQRLVNMTREMLPPGYDYGTNL